MLMLHIKDAAKLCEQSISIKNRSLLQLNIRSTNQFFLHGRGMCSLFNNKVAYFCEKVSNLMHKLTK
jgi:hypothetical protein